MPVAQPNTSSRISLKRESKEPTTTENWIPEFELLDGNPYKTNTAHEVTHATTTACTFLKETLWKNPQSQQLWRMRIMKSQITIHRSNKNNLKRPILPTRSTVHTTYHKKLTWWVHSHPKSNRKGRAINYKGIRKTHSPGPQSLLRNGNLRTAQDETQKRRGDLYTPRGAVKAGDCGHQNGRKKKLRMELGNWRLCADRWWFRWNQWNFWAWRRHSFRETLKASCKYSEGGGAGVVTDCRSAITWGRSPSEPFPQRYPRLTFGDPFWVLWSCSSCLWVFGRTPLSIIFSF